ncbi:hypothetical protein ACHAQA_009389 [Verticillium albo-atrum]
MASCLHLAFAATALLSLALPVSAQIQTNDTFSYCPLPIRNIASNRIHNSTGTIAIPFEGHGDPWYISTTISDRRNPGVFYNGWATIQDLGIFLSVPDDLPGSATGNETRICAYTMPGQNATSEGDGLAENSCKGVMSDECIEAYLNAPMPPQDGPCPAYDVEDRCDIPTGIRTITPLVLNESRCALDELPHSGVPDGYSTFSGFPAGFMLPPDGNQSEFEVYDLRVRQPVPMLFTVRSGSTAQAHLVCLAPSDVVEGSREPEAEFPPSGAAGLRGGLGVAAAAAAVAVIALVAA